MTKTKYLSLQYVDELMQRGESCEFYIEGGRTRSGKALYPKGGLLSVVVDSYIEGIYHIDINALSGISNTDT